MSAPVMQTNTPNFDMRGPSNSTLYPLFRRAPSDAVLLLVGLTLLPEL